MKKLVIIVSFMVLVPLIVYSQKSLPNGQVAFGIKGGVNMAKMTYTDNHLSCLPQSIVYCPIGGVFIDFPVTSQISIAPEILYVGRGGNTSYTHYSGENVLYEIHSRYIDLRFPLLLGISFTDKFQPYMVIGFDAGWVLGGSIHLNQHGMPCADTTIMIGSANMHSIRAGVFGGVGIRWFKLINGKRAQVKIDVTFCHDYLDSFANKEHDDTASPVNVNAYNITGKRFSKGLEISLGMIIPIFPDKNDACYYFSKNKW